MSDLWVFASYENFISFRDALNLYCNMGKKVKLLWYGFKNLVKLGGLGYTKIKITICRTVFYFWVYISFFARLCALNCNFLPLMAPCYLAYATSTPLI